MDDQMAMLLFRNEVKSRFPSQPHVYHQVIHLLSRYNLKSISVQQLQETVELLLHEHQDLIQMFHSLSILFPSQTEEDNNQMSEKARDFFLKVKEVHPEKYESFVTILCNFSNSSLKETCEQVQMLFQDHPTILKEFESMVLPDFVPKGDSVWTKSKLSPRKPSNLVLGSEKQREPEPLARSMSASGIQMRKKLPMPPRAITWTGSEINVAKASTTKAKAIEELSSSIAPSLPDGQRKGPTTVVPLGLVKLRAKTYADMINGGTGLSPNPRE